MRYPTSTILRPPTTAAVADAIVEQYHQIAVTAFRTHRANSSCCQSCGQHWPCPAVCTAAAALGI
ncbi:MAG TPA: hypothetical protein VGM75_16255 [Pseudonocardiaceae bacterium]